MRPRTSIIKCKEFLLKYKLEMIEAMKHEEGNRNMHPAHLEIVRLAREEGVFTEKSTPQSTWARLAADFYNI